MFHDTAMTVCVYAFPFTRICIDEWTESRYYDVRTNFAMRELRLQASCVCSNDYSSRSFFQFSHDYGNSALD